MNGFIHISLTKSYHMLEYSFLKGVVDRVYEGNAGDVENFHAGPFMNESFHQ